MRIFAKIRQVYDRLCERKEAGAERLYLAPDGVLTDEAPHTRRKRLLAVERDSKLLGADFGNGG